MQTAIQSGAHALQFQNTHFDVIDRNGVPWLRSAQIAEALGYSQANRITDIYNRHADEFTNDMTAVVKLQDLNPQSAEAGQMREVRIFSPRGCYALGMFSRTPVSATFRKWALDVLEGKISIGSVPPAPTSPTLSDALTLYRESVQALLLTQPMQHAHLLACKSATRATGIDLEGMWAGPPQNLSALYLSPDKNGNPRIARHVSEIKAKILQVVKNARRYRAAAYYGLTRQGVMPYGYALTLCKVHSEQFRQVIGEMLEAGSIRQAPPDIYMGGMMCFVAGGAA